MKKYSVEIFEVDERGFKGKQNFAFSCQLTRVLNLMLEDSENK
jgi:hypothetical protein